MRDVTVATATASMTGKVKVKSPVSSTTLASEVSGAPAADANTAPMATTAYRAGGPADGPNRRATNSPKAMPEVAPTNSEGANTPPDPPMPKVTLQARIFPAASTSRNQNA